MNRVFGDTFAAFQNRDFRILWAGAFLAFIAFFMSLPVQAVVAFDLSGTNSGVGWVVAGQGVAQMVLGPFGGALADRLSKRLVIFVCQALITLSFLGLAVMLSAGLISVPWLVAGSFMIGAAFSFLGPARQGLMVELVAPTRRGNAVALSQVALNLSRVLAPLIAAAFLAVDVVGAAGAFYLMTGLYLAAMVATYLMPATKPSGTTRAVLPEIWSGIRYVARTPRINLLVPSYILTIAVGFTYTAVLPGLVQNELHRDASQITWLLIANAVGGFAASLAVASRADSARAGVLYTAMCLVFGLSLLAAGFTPSYWVLMVLMLLIGAGGGGFQTLNGALVSHLTDPAYFGRVVSLTFLAFAVSSVVALPIGVLADAIGERNTIAVSGAIVVGITVLFVAAERAMRSGAAPEPAALSSHTGS
ncbi:MAG: MFS transporter [Dehalococcoidia bacterium]